MCGCVEMRGEIREENNAPKMKKENQIFWQRLAKKSTRKLEQWPRWMENPSCSFVKKAGYMQRVELPAFTLQIHPSKYGNLAKFIRGLFVQRGKKKRKPYEKHLIYSRFRAVSHVCCNLWNSSDRVIFSSKREYHGDE